MSGVNVNRRHKERPAGGLSTYDQYPEGMSKRWLKKIRVGVNGFTCGCIVSICDDEEIKLESWTRCNKKNCVVEPRWNEIKRLAKKEGFNLIVSNSSTVKPSNRSTQKQ